MEMTQGCGQVEKTTSRGVWLLILRQFSAETFVPKINMFKDVSFTRIPAICFQKIETNRSSISNKLSKHQKPTMGRYSCMTLVIVMLLRKKGKLLGPLAKLPKLAGTFFLELDGCIFCYSSAWRRCHM
eukprot:1532558-Amphidinium_carterae.1